MKVEDCMTKNVICVGASEPVSVAARLMARYNVGTLPVQRVDGTLSGMVTDRDLVLRCVAANKDPERIKVGEIMSNRVVSVSPEAELPKAAAIMSAEQVRRLPVVRNEKLVGMVTLGDLSRQEAYSRQTAESLAEITCGVRRLGDL